MRGYATMIKILFICHGNDFLQSLIPCISYGFPEMWSVFVPVLYQLVLWKEVT